MKRVRFVKFLIVISVLSTGLLVFYWFPPNPDRKNYIESYPTLEKMNMENVTYSFEIFVWSYFIPIVPPDGPPLYIFIIIHAVGVSEFPLAMSIKRLWLIKGTEISSV